MILLQAAIAAGAVLVGKFGIFLLIGVPVFTMLFMKAYWKLSNQEEKIQNQLPYYKEPLPFLINIILAVCIVILVFYFFISILNFPDFSYSN